MSKTEDDSLDAFMRGEDDLARALGELAQPEPDAALDAAILAQAGMAPAANDADGGWAWRRWLGLAACLVVAVLVGRQWGEPVVPGTVGRQETEVVAMSEPETAPPPPPPAKATPAKARSKPVIVKVVPEAVPSIELPVVQMEVASTAPAAPAPPPPAPAPASVAAAPRMVTVTGSRIGDMMAKPMALAPMEPADKLETIRELLDADKTDEAKREWEALKKAKPDIQIAPELRAKLEQ